MATTSTLTGLSGSWKTSITGIITIVVAILNALKLLVDGDPTTNPDWSLLIASITAGLGLLFARDNNVSSESAGAK